MKVVYSPQHRDHSADRGSWVGVTIPSEEVPERVELIVAELRNAGHEIVDTERHDDSVLVSIHDPAMVEYMGSAWEKWIEHGYDVEPGQDQVTAYAFPTAGFLGGRPMRLPKSPGALAGVYAMDTMTQIGRGTFQGARAAIDMAQTAADLVVSGELYAYAACRPPGHHAGPGFFGGSCYLNNAAAAAATLRRGGFDQVTVIDLDAHHGNGTQEIFFDRADVGYASVHVDPGEGWFPHFVGFADEIGSGPGQGANLNVPLEPGAGDGSWLRGVEKLVAFARGRESSAVVVSLGVDAAISDPESPLQISESGYAEAGARIASLGLPTVFVQEGGYDLTTIGDLVRATLEGFEQVKEKELHG